MFQISVTTYDTFAKDYLPRWLHSVVMLIAARHPKWAAQIGNDQIVATCQSLERFSQTYGLSQHDSLLLLIDLIAETGYDLTTTAFQHDVLSRPSFSEALRLRRHVADVRGNPPLRLVDIAGMQESHD